MQLLVQLHIYDTCSAYLYSTLSLLAWSSYNIMTPVLNRKHLTSFMPGLYSCLHSFNCYPTHTYSTHRACTHYAHTCMDGLGAIHPSSHACATPTPCYRYAHTFTFADSAFLAIYA